MAMSANYGSKSPDTCNGDVLIWVKNSREGAELQTNKQTSDKPFKKYQLTILILPFINKKQNMLFNRHLKIIIHNANLE